MRISVPTTKSCKRKGCSLRGGGFLRFGEELATEAKAAQPGGAKPRPYGSFPISSCRGGALLLPFNIL